MYTKNIPVDSLFNTALSNGCGNTKRLTVVLAAALFFSFICYNTASADQFTFTPGIQERVTWNDNFFLKDFSDVELHTEPRFSSDYKSELTTVKLAGRLQDFRYANETNYDRTTYQLSGNAARQLTERLNVGAGGSWLRDSSLDTFWDDNFDQRTMIERDLYSVSGDTSYDLTEVDRLQFNIAWADMEYRKQLSQYANYTMLNGSMTWQHMLFDGTMAFIAQASWQHIEFDSPASLPIDYGLFGKNRNKQDMTQDVYSTMGGIYWMPMEKLTMQLMLGANYTESKVELESTWSEGLIALDDTHTKDYYYNTGITGSLDVTWKEDNRAFRALLNQEFLPSTTGELRRTTRATISYNRIFNRKFNIYNSINFANTSNDDVGHNKISEDFWHVIFQPTYKFTQDFAMRLQYTFSYKDDRDDHRKQRSNSVFLQFAYDFPMHF